MKTFGRDALTWLRDHEAAAAGSSHHTACYPGNHRITMGVTGDQATTRLPGTQPSGHMHAGIAARTGGPDPAICHGMTAGAVSDLDLPGTAPLGSAPGRGPGGRPGLAPGHPAAAASAPEGLAAYHARIRALAAGVPAAHREAVAAFLAAAAAAAAAAAGEISR